jgi:hypothetical protein
MPKTFWYIWVAYLLLAGVYATITPMFEKQDENWHFAAAMYILETGTLPQNTPDGATLHYARQQANQPPFYYLSLALIWRIVGFQELTSGYLTLAKPNEQFRPNTRLTLSDNQRQFIQGRCEDVCATARNAAYIA